MKKQVKNYRRLWLLLLCFLVLSGTTAAVFRSLRQEQLNRALIAAIRTDHSAGIVTSLLSQGADPNARYVTVDRRPLWIQLWDRMRGTHRQTPYRPTALEAALTGSKERRWSDEDILVANAYEVD